METRKLRMTGWMVTVLAVTLLSGLPAHGQSEAEKALLDKARSLDARGRLDLAAQNWQQVLLSDPNNSEALAGVAKADMVAGKSQEAHGYLDRLRSVNPTDPRIAEIETMQKQREATPQVQRAGKLAESGQYGQAMSMYRQAYGTNPPAGDVALAYYETEAATEDGRAHAIAGLREMAKRYPDDARYEVTLGRILTYQPKTRAEGIALLEKHPKDGQANEALRQALTWDAANPASSAAIRNYLKTHPDKDLQAHLSETEARRAKLAGDYAKTADERAAYDALQSSRPGSLDLAEKRFMAIKEREPNNPRVLAGLGFVRMKQNNFGAAISYLESAKSNGAKGAVVDNALITSRFWFTMSEGTAALSENQLDVAIAQFRKALEMRPASAEALTGLAGTLLRAQQPAEAAQVYGHLVHIQPSNAGGWRGLFTAQYLMGDAHAALSTVGRFPAPVRTALAKDPEYLTNLAAAYASVGDEADSQRVLAQAMETPFPNNGVGMKPDTQLQFAGLLAQAGHYDQAAGLYRQVIAANPNEAQAYQGIVRAEHAMGNDAQALASVEEMPPAVLAASERDPGFLATIAAIYQSQGKMDIAQKFMEQAVAESTAGGQAPSVNVELELAGIYVQGGNAQAAYAIYQRVLTSDPGRLDAWRGLISALHESSRDREALAELKQIPPDTMARLGQDPQFLQILASVYSGAGDQRLALSTIRQAALHYQQGNAQPPVGLAIQYSYLLLNSGDDQGLYVQLMQLGSRSDLTPDQRTQVQTVWAVWSVRRAAAAAKFGNYHRSIQILDAANRAFPNNPDVQKALAGGYQQAGENKRAEAIYLQMDWTNAKVADYRAAIGAALAAHDTKQAQMWLDSGLKQFPNDPSILQEAAEFEQAKGDNVRAAEYYKASLDAMGPEDPAQSLLRDMGDKPDKVSGMMLPGGEAGTNPSQELMNVLAPGTDAALAQPMPMSDMAPLPGGNYLPGQAPVQINPNGTPVGPMAGSQSGYSRRKLRRGSAPPAPQQNVERLGDYAPPQSSLTPADECALNRMAGVDCGFVPSDNSGATVSGWTIRDAVWQAAAPRQGQPQGDTEVSVAPNSKLRTAPAPNRAAQPVTAVPPPQPPIQMVQNAAPAQPVPHMHLRMPSAAATTTATTVPPATATAAVTATAAAAGARAPAAPAKSQVETVPGIKYAQGGTQQTYSRAQFQSATGAPAYAAPAQDQAQPQREQQPPAQESPVQQAPVQQRPPAVATGPYQATPAQPYSAGPAPSYNSNPNGAQSGPQGYGTYSQGAGSPYNPGYGPGYSAYSDSQAPVQQQPYYARRLPPLTGAYQQSIPRGGLQTQRDKVADQLAALQGGYSPWLGGTGMVSYRSGTPGFDRFVVFQSPIEASAVLSDAVRATVVLRPVLIDSGTPQASPIYGLGTLGKGIVPPTQTASGIGGEVQLRSANYGISAGYTPYGFVVGNFIGSIYARPQAGPFTLSFTRDSVTDTQLSYSGLHDPGLGATAGQIWGGVIANSGEVQFASTTDHSGYYVQGGGQYLTGKNVLDNYRADGDAGAYWRIAELPEYGNLTLGMNLFAMHYQHNLRYFTFGQGGYFSPDAYLLANVPVTFNGHYGRNFHYRINGSLGIQAFQEDSSPFFPLQTNVSCSSTSVNCYPTRDSISGNYLIDAEAAYRMTEHWFVGAFVNANNSRDYNTATVGFYVRYMFRSQFPTEDGPPTGIFPVNGLRPIQVP